ncbi:MAG TPA: 4-hydroxybutyrate CoA-transferase, partial [Saprospiraceae bacterium]|nr:4-hydroxybutyrate CoA-transferase [Saprospiraceae bacterium]
MKIQSAEHAVNRINSGNRVFFQGGVATPTSLMKALFKRKNELKNVELLSISTLGNLVFDPEEIKDSF